MRSLPVCGLLLMLAVPAFAQQSTPAPTADASPDYTALRDSMVAKNKDLNDQLTNQRAMVKKNQDMLKEAQKMDAANKKLEAEKQKLEAQNADLEKQREALKSGDSAMPAPSK